VLILNGKRFYYILTKLFSALHFCHSENGIVILTFASGLCLTAWALKILKSYYRAASDLVLSVLIVCFGVC
jgi:hypothetical protein